MLAAVKKETSKLKIGAWAEVTWHLDTRYGTLGTRKKIRLVLGTIHVKTTQYSVQYDVQHVLNKYKYVTISLRRSCMAVQLYNCV